MGAESVQSIVKYMRKNGKAEEKGMKERKRKKGIQGPRYETVRGQRGGDWKACSQSRTFILV